MHGCAVLGRYDVGVWAMEYGELVTPLRPRLRLWFNSASTHQCLPSWDLLPWACEPARLATEATKFAKMRTAEALEHVLRRPELEAGFATPELAAAYHSSLVGSTTFQQRAVTHALMKAALADTLGKVLRPASWERGPAHARSAEATAGSGDARTHDERLPPIPAELSDKKERALELQRLLDLERGEHIRVFWESGECHDGRVEEVIAALDVRDVAVLVYYPHRDAQFSERLGFHRWMSIRSRGSGSGS
jgi:hypothetical protein